MCPCSTRSSVCLSLLLFVVARVRLSVIAFVAAFALLLLLFRGCFAFVEAFLVLWWFCFCRCFTVVVTIPLSWRSFCHCCPFCRCCPCRGFPVAVTFLLSLLFFCRCSHFLVFPAVVARLLSLLSFAVAFEVAFVVYLVVVVLWCSFEDTFNDLHAHANICVKITGVTFVLATSCQRFESGSFYFERCKCRPHSGRTLKLLASATTDAVVDLRSGARVLSVGPVVYGLQPCPGVC
mgnify:CR=1 FL=1